ncbi:uncharacterized protein LOC108711762 isoform X2 [Xenopus laevis]|uniref:Uncharacterized protein LOC108711762 isoform X2 n=1 Tax=Xenopus laevis TaxID=8355 RepID=A0A8J0ULN2_XENLA|nr:uncharacterized protein LOC108711762 isoform X2 [Xenopus laevis]
MNLLLTLFLLWTCQENWVHGSYTGRISLEGNPKEQNVVSLRIQKISRTDGPMFCCRLEPEDNGLKPWQNIQGTFIQFPGEFSVQQVDTVPAIEGETTIIPCLVHSAPGEIREVTWRWGDSPMCSDNPNTMKWTSDERSEKHTEFSLVDFPRDVSLRIKGVAPSHRKHYCCEVKVRDKTAQSVQGTELGVAASSPSDTFSITQSPELTVQSGDSASINCTFSSPHNRDPLWVGVYWRVGNRTGPFAYHPSQEMVHPMYKGRTELRGEADLYIRNVQEADNNTSYYCFVMLRFCEDINKFSTKTIHGTGSSLHVTALSETGWFIPLVLTLIALLLLVGTLAFLRIKGKICFSTNKGQETSISRSPDASPISPTNPPSGRGTLSPEPDRNPQTDPEESSGILYSHINHKGHSSQYKKENSTAESEGGASVLYAVVGSADHGAVDASVQKRNISASSPPHHNQ